MNGDIIPREKKKKSLIPQVKRKAMADHTIFDGLLKSLPPFGTC